MPPTARVPDSPAPVRAVRFGLRTQLAVVAAGILLLAVAAAAGLRTALARNEAQHGWVLHTQEVISTAESLARSAADAQAGMRGYLVTGDRTFLDPFVSGSAAFRRDAERLRGLSGEDPDLRQRVAGLVDRFDGWCLATSNPLVVFSRSVEPAQRARLLADGGVRMAELRRVIDALILTEQQLLGQRRDEGARRTRLLELASGAGFAVAVLLAAGMGLVVAVRVARATEALTAAAVAVADGDLKRRARIEGRDELAELGRAFNAMAARLDRRHREETALKRLRELLHASQTPEEALAVFTQLGPRCLAVSRARLYLMNASRNLLVPGPGWGDSDVEHPFPPSECWGLRGGRAQLVVDPGLEIACRHLGACRGPGLCLPLLAQGETVGMLHLVPTGELTPVLPDVAEMLSLTLANLRLRETLHHQAVRDPLTGLYNRRYMEESFQRELARATRTGTPLSIIVFDVDHFKRFNDTHGHAAGDAVLRAVGRALAEAFRESDIVARWGGEEFVAALPDCPPEEARLRADAVRDRLRAAEVRHEGGMLGGVTVSAGIAAFALHGADAETLLRNADRALYRAKAEGRDRTRVSEAA